MDLRFATPSLEAIDTLKSDALVSFFFAEERPLQGTSGIVDWRLCGLLSRCLVEGRLTGQMNECVLVPAFPHLSIERVFLAGLGAVASFSVAVFATAVRDMLTRLHHAGARTVIWSLPGRNTDAIAPLRALERFLALLDEHDSPPELTVIEKAECHRELLPLVEAARRRARAASSAP